MNASTIYVYDGLSQSVVSLQNRLIRLISTRCIIHSAYKPLLDYLKLEPLTFKRVKKLTLFFFLNY